MKRRINEEIGTSVSDSVKSIVFIDIGSYLANKAGSLVIMTPEVGPQKIMKWSKFVHTNPMYQENKSHFEALTARFSGNTILNSIYAKINKIKSATVASAEENTTREQQITRELSRAGRYIQSKLTDIEKQLFAKVSPDLRNPSLLLVKSLNDKLTSTVSTPEPEEPAKPETPETPETPPEATTKPAAEPAAEPTPAAEPKPVATKKAAPSPEPAPAEPAAPETKPAPKAAEKPAPKPTTPKSAETPAPKAAAPKAAAPKAAAPKAATPKAATPKAAPKPAPAEEPEEDDKKTEESIRKIKSAIREYVLREIQDTVSEATLDEKMDWKSLSTPLVIGGKDVGFVLPNGIKLNTTLNQVWVESPDLIHKVSLLLTNRVIRPANYQKTHKILSFGYNQIDEDAIGLVLFDIK